MGELGEKIWAVMSERGCEASGLVYGEAARLARRLRDEKISGLCVVTTAAAERLTQPTAVSAGLPSPPPAAEKGSRREVEKLESS